MSKFLSPRLIFVSGMTASGKSSLARELARCIVNGVCLNRDSILYGGLLCVDENFAAPSLPSFRQYVAKDIVFPDNCEVVDTPFGPMTRVFHIPGSDYHGRHARDQGYLVQIRLAEENVQIGKVPILDGYQMRHIDGGSLQRVMDLPVFRPYPKYLIHTMVDPEECYRRLRGRGETDYEGWVQARVHKNKESFLKFLESRQKSIPDGLKNFPHLIVDTTNRTIDECAKECLTYIQS